MCCRLSSQISMFACKLHGATTSAVSASRMAARCTLLYRQKHVFRARTSWWSLSTPDETPEAASLATLRWSHLPMRSTGAPHTRRGVCALVRHVCQDVMTNMARREPWHKCVLVIGSFVKTILFGGYKLFDSAVSFEAKALADYPPSAPLRRVVEEMSLLTGRTVSKGSRYLCLSDPVRVGQMRPYVHAVDCAGARGGSGGGGTEPSPTKGDPDFVLRQLIACLSPVLEPREAADLTHIVTHTRRLCQSPTGSSRAPWQIYLSPSQVRTQTDLTEGERCDSD
jgi:hypothetical protein